MASQEVVLELNNIEEEEELEELEDGRCPAGAEDVDTSPPPFQEDKPTPSHTRQKWVECDIYCHWAAVTLVLCAQV